ncbi:hypothetical protein WJX73_009402 [Symbiochloris irregularis]|uniref:Putative gamma-glutamylcyclotransferase n=1 Tax=Symbiochloris irregularis TaxID=706552 RepID=A0AAW1PRI2_9CHLO
MHSVFVYGTLMAEEVTHALLHRLPPTHAATLAGFKRHRIENQVFPAIVATSSADTIQGLLVTELTDEELDVFDEFEDIEYTRDEVLVTGENGAHKKAFVYVWKDTLRHLLYGEWDYNEFREKHLEKYLTLCFRSSGHPTQEVDVPPS